MARTSCQGPRFRAGWRSCLRPPACRERTSPKLGCQVAPKARTAEAEGASPSPRAFRSTGHVYILTVAATSRAGVGPESAPLAVEVPRLATPAAANEEAATDGEAARPSAAAPAEDLAAERRGAACGAGGCGIPKCREGGPGQVPLAAGVGGALSRRISERPPCDLLGPHLQRSDEVASEGAPNPSLKATPYVIEHIVGVVRL